MPSKYVPTLDIIKPEYDFEKLFTFFNEEFRYHQVLNQYYVKVELANI